MGLSIYVEGHQNDVERFYDTIIYPEIERLHEDNKFLITVNDCKYIPRRENIVERVIRGYSKTLRYKNRPGLWEQYFVNTDDLTRKTYINIHKYMPDECVTIYLRSYDPSEIKLFYDEFMKSKAEQFVIEEDTDIYHAKNRTTIVCRHIYGRFNNIH